VSALADIVAENFALGVVAFSGNLRAAYVSATNVDPRFPRLTVLANEMIARPDVAYRIRELQEARSGTMHFTEDMHLYELAHIRDSALSAGNHMAALMAEKSRGEVAGMYKARIESTVNHKYRIDMPPAALSLEDWAKANSTVPLIQAPAIDSTAVRVPSA
jgi:hypothetical protein